MGTGLGRLTALLLLADASLLGVALATWLPGIGRPLLDFLGASNVALCARTGFLGALVTALAFSFWVVRAARMARSFAPNARDLDFVLAAFYVPIYHIVFAPKVLLLIHRASSSLDPESAGRHYPRGFWPWFTGWLLATGWTSLSWLYADFASSEAMIPMWPVTPVGIFIAGLAGSRLVVDIDRSQARALDTAASGSSTATPRVCG